MRKKFYTALEIIIKSARKELGNIDFSIMASSIRELLDRLEHE